MDGECEMPDVSNASIHNQKCVVLSSCANSLVCSKLGHKIMMILQRCDSWQSWWMANVKRRCCRWPPTPRSRCSLRPTWSQPRRCTHTSLPEVYGTVTWYKTPKLILTDINSKTQDRGSFTLSMVSIRWFEPRRCSMNLYSSALLLTLSMVRIRWFEPRSCSMDIRRTCRWAESLYRLQINKKKLLYFSFLYFNDEFVFNRWRNCL